jgi:hypothetical protein
LAVYSGTNVTNLTLVVSDDDSAGFLCSSVSFNAQAGSNYVIQVDGFYGMTGDLVLAWSLTPTSDLLPVIITPPHSQTVGLGAPASLSVTTPASPPLNFQWFQDGSTISNATNATLDFPAVDPTQVGVYQVMVVDPATMLSATPMGALLQINIPDVGQPVNTNARAEDEGWNP